MIEVQPLVFQLGSQPPSQGMIPTQVGYQELGKAHVSKAHMVELHHHTLTALAVLAVRKLFKHEWANTTACKIWPIIVRSTDAIVQTRIERTRIGC